MEHVARMADKINAHKVLFGIPERSRPLGVVVRVILKQIAKKQYVVGSCPGSMNSTCYLKVQLPVAIFVVKLPVQLSSYLRVTRFCEFPVTSYDDTVMYLSLQRPPYVWVCQLQASRRNVITVGKTVGGGCLKCARHQLPVFVCPWAGHYVLHHH